MKEISILIGGQAGDGIKQAANSIARLFNRLGYYIFVYEDYPSLIRGGHNFSIIRASREKIYHHREKFDILIALNQETIDLHRKSLNAGGVVVFDSGVSSFRGGLGIEMTKIVRENKLPPIARNTLSFGFLAGILGIDFSLAGGIIKETISSFAKENLKVAKIGYKKAEKIIAEGLGEPFGKVEKTKNDSKPLLTGNEAIALGAVSSGLDFYIAYPMTPATGILHFLAQNEDYLQIKVVQPENEISAVLMAEGVAYGGLRVAVGTSGGGFALMTEALSMAGQAEIPIMFILSQRPAPGTGVPTYSMQGDLLFAINAGHGEFLKIIAAPANAEQAFDLSAELLDLAWKFQTPTILLSDKNLSESTFSFDGEETIFKKGSFSLWSGKGNYQRYVLTENGISPMAFPGTKNATIKSTSYAHDEYGLSAEQSESVKRMTQKMIVKRESAIKELKNKKTIMVYGNKKSKNAVISWGSSVNPLIEISSRMDLRVIQPLYLNPFPIWAIEKELAGVQKIFAVEANVFGQLTEILSQNNINVSRKILKYDARPFGIEELEKKLLGETNT